MLSRSDPERSVPCALGEDRCWSERSRGFCCVGAARADAPHCAAAKLRAAAKKASTKIACHRKAVLSGTTVDDACIARAEDRFVRAFAAAEARGGCVTAMDAADVEAAVDQFVADLLARLPVTTTTSTSTTTSSSSTPTVSCGVGARAPSGSRAAAWGDLSRRAVLRLRRPGRLHLLGEHLHHLHDADELLDHDVAALAGRVGTRRGPLIERRRGGTRRKMAWVALLYFAEGLPFGFVKDVLPVYFRVHGVSLRDIGLASLITMPWSLKFLWAPLVDQLGERRQWIAGALVVMAASLLVAQGLPAAPVATVLVVTLLCFTVAAATQDIAIDAYTIEMLVPGEEASPTASASRPTASR
jgi:hypothetical protein